MKIYQIHEYSGQWEDFCDRIIGSYLKKEKAEEAIVKAMEKEKERIEQGKKCANCPFLDDPFESVASLWPKHKDYCAEAKLSDSEYGINCENYYSHWDEADFEIKEVEVIE